MSMKSPACAPLSPTRVSGRSSSEEAMEVGRKLVEVRTRFTGEALRASLAQR